MKCKTCGETDKRKMDACAYGIRGIGPRCEWVPDVGEQKRAAEAVNEIWTILRNLDSPNVAARALAGLHVMLMEANGVQTETHVRAALKDVDAAVLETWAKRSGISLAS